MKLKRFLFKNNFFLLKKNYKLFSTEAEPLKNYYQILEIKRNSTQREIKKGFQKMTKKYHPDVYDKDDSKFQRILEAFSILKNPITRKKFDNKLNKKKEEPIYYEDIKNDKNQNNQNSEEYENDKKEKKDYNNFFKDSYKKENYYNLDKEVDKLFKRKIKINFEKIRIYENEFEKQLDDSELDRLKFVEKYNEKKSKKLDLNLETKLNFKESLDEFVELENENFHQEKKKEEEKPNKFVFGIKEELFYNILLVISCSGILCFCYYSFKLKKFYKEEKAKAVQLLKMEYQFKNNIQRKAALNFGNQVEKDIKYDFRKN